MCDAIESDVREVWRRALLYSRHLTHGYEVLGADADVSVDELSAIVEDVCACLYVGWWLENLRPLIRKRVTELHREG